jgi:hypothetical protein
MPSTQGRDYSTASNRNPRFQPCLCAKPWFPHGKRPRERNTVFAKHSGCRQFPRCQLHGRVTADVRVRAARGWSCFRVGDDTGVGRLRSTLRRLYWPAAIFWESQLFIPNPFCVRPAAMMRTGALGETLVCCGDHFTVDPARRGVAAVGASANPLPSLNSSR